MHLILIEYPKCSTCQKSTKWLEQRGAAFDFRHIVEQAPKEKLPLMSEEAQICVAHLQRYS